MVRWSKVFICILVLLGWMQTGISRSAAAQTTASKKKVSSEADLPRFSYPMTGTASSLLMADDATFDAFARKVGADVNSVLADYAIEDKATLRELLGDRLNVQILTGDSDGATATLAQVRNLEEKPEAKMTSGLTTRSLLQARAQSGVASGAAFDKAFEKNFADAVNALPWAPVQDWAKEHKASYQILTPDYLMSSLKVHGDPEALKSKAVDFPTATNLLAMRVFTKFLLPVQKEILAVLTSYIDAHNVQKPDIWPTRDVALTPDQKLTPVRVAILDSGVDTSLFPTLLFTDPSPEGHSPHGLAYNLEGNLYAGDLQPLTAEQKELYPKVLTIEQGLNDLQSNIDSTAAANARKYLSTTPPDQLAPVMKQMEFLGQWMHGTHVAGIAVRGNPAARLVVVQFNDSLPDIPFAPTVEWADRFKADVKHIGEYFRDNDVRVVNMSWADSQSEIEQWLTRTSSEKDPAVRKQFAAQIYGIWKDGVEGMIQSAPKTLFVCAAGNSDSNAGFLGDVPASLQLPNLVTVGAVDQAGEETSFTSYGNTIVLDADGFQVESFVPGGTRIKFSGTSMASPNVVNLAAKLIALNPSLTPEQTIELMKKGAETSANGRLHLINPKATVALLEQQAK
jgi:hypothetical protein